MAIHPDQLFHDAEVALMKVWKRKRNTDTVIFEQFGFQFSTVNFFTSNYRMFHNVETTEQQPLRSFFAVEFIFFLFSDYC